MDRNETQAALRLLLAVARADGTVSQDEERALEVASEKLGETVPAEGSIDLGTEAARLASREAKIATFEAAVALATVDGRCAPEEHALLERLRAALGLDLPLPVVEREARWVERMREPRERMASAEIEFLHAMARKAEGVSSDEYRAMIDELHRARAAALHDALDPTLEGRVSYFA